MEISRAGSKASDRGPADWFTGSVRIDRLFQAPPPARAAGVSVTFEPGARTAWHTHPLGQTLVVTAGKGLAQRWGGEVEDIRPGDVIWFAPGEKHWHGASPTTAMTHIAIQEQMDGRTVDWLEQVSDREYPSPRSNDDRHVSVTPEKWFARRFDAQPASRLPVILERLRGTSARLEERLRDVAATTLTRHAEGAWSVQENVGHLIDLESLWRRRVEQLFAGETELAPTDLANRRTFEAGHNERALADLLAEFRRVRQALVALIAGADEAALARTALHPRLRTPMTITDLAHFVAEHDDHHLATIAALIDRPSR